MNIVMYALLTHHCTMNRATDNDMTLTVENLFRMISLLGRREKWERVWVKQWNYKWARDRARANISIFSSIEAFREWSELLNPYGRSSDALRMLGSNMCLFQLIKAKGNRGWEKRQRRGKMVSSLPKSFNVPYEACQCLILYSFYNRVGILIVIGGKLMDDY